MKYSCFVAGTDTEIGKTTITLALMEFYKQKGFKVAAMKPVASGAEETAGGLRNNDALLLQKHSSKDYAYEQINPYPLIRPVSPYIAAKQQKVIIREKEIMCAFQSLQANTDLVIMEGLGGWRMPLDDSLQMSDLVRKLQIPVFLVVGLRLGCINHALLTVESIAKDGVNLAGWFANRIDPDYESADETVGLLCKRINAPLMGVVPWFAVPEESDIVSYFEPQFLLNLVSK